MTVPPHDIVDRGVSMVPEGRGIFARLTVTENLEMGAFSAVTRRKSLRAWSGSSHSSPASRNAASRSAGRYPAASSRCWRPGAR